MYLNMQRQFLHQIEIMEITDLNKIYLKKNKLNIFLDRGDVWLDAGTHVSLMQANY